MTARCDLLRVRSHHIALFSLTLLSLLAIPRVATSQILQRSIAFQNARILAADGLDIAEGTLVVSGDKIRAVGKDAKLPAFAKKIDATGKTITAGLIDAGSVLGRAGSRSGGSASHRAEDAFDHFDTNNVQEALRQGVTTIFLSPQGPTGVSGTGAVIRLTRATPTASKVGSTLKSEAALCIDLGSANKPVARIKTFQSIQKAFKGARQYRQSLETYDEELVEYGKKLDEWVKKKAAEKKAAEKKDAEKKAAEKKDAEKKDAEKKVSPKPSAADEKKPEPKKPYPKKPAAKKPEDSQPKKPRRPARSTTNEVLLKALDGEIPVRLIAHRSSDILNALDLAEEFSLKLILEGAAEAHLVADQIAASDAIVLLGRMDLPTQRANDALRRRVEFPGVLLDEAEIPWAVGSGASDTDRTRFVLLNAQLAVARTDRDALQMVTARAADVLQVPQIGRLQPGKLADFVLWSGDPADPASEVSQVFVGGKEVYAASD